MFYLAITTPFQNNRTDGIFLFIHHHTPKYQILKKEKNCLCECPEFFFFFFGAGDNRIYSIVSYVIFL